MVNIFGKDIWQNWNWNVLNPATFGLIGIITMLGTAYELCRKNEISPLPGVVTSLMTYFLLIALDENGMLSVNEFGASSLFLSIIVAIISVEIYTLCIKKNIIIRLPGNIPSFVQDQFVALIPSLILRLYF